MSVVETPKTSSSVTEMHRLELIVSQLLRLGVLIAGALLFIGWVWMWINGNDISGNLKEYNPTTFTDTLQWAVIMQDRALLTTMMGLVILVTLPVVRVLLTAILFIKQKDYRLAIMAIFVFAFLCSSFFLGIDL
ncbi:hypothetical protein AZI86_12920 [Bdellovibrio bacteriovorus]|uniref:DUF1634 domain-containing protein n=1 Tax=Bdellovibrio bacteriovorus TaxID=959 RepID=A0A150WJM0_BDEBC|nr:DUF1634 domain-containing protein [Bdellovibrio bacteriovorus]KYG63721.1 hypothetical protein AZI86_12920 [Bdellovibrio bacteriovorus]